MGQDISKSFTPPPLSFRDCLVDGRIDLTRYRIYSRRQYEDAYNDPIFSTKSKRKHDESEPKKQVIRSVKRHIIQFPNDDGTMLNVTFKDSTWYNLYIHNPPTSKRQLKIFRRRFRLPYAEFITMIEDIKTNENFIRWRDKDCIGNEPSDMRLLLMGTLRYIGRGLTFDDIEEFSFISGEVHRNFFAAFIEYGSTYLYNKYVVNPASDTDVSAFEKVFSLAGFNGCIGSTDGTHVGLLSCPS